MESGFLEILQQGGLAIYPLVICSVLGLAIVFERGFYLAKAYKTLNLIHPQIIQDLENGHKSAAKELTQDIVFGGLYQNALNLSGASEQKILKTLDRNRFEEVQKLKTRIWILGTIGSLAPFIGLFGTVVGIMHAFKEIARTQEGGFTTVSAGISEALIATAAGIFVGVLSVAAYNFFSIQITQISLKLKTVAEQIVEALILEEEEKVTLVRRK